MQEYNLFSVMDNVKIGDFWKDFAHPLADKIEKIVQSMSGQVFITIYRTVIEKVGYDNYMDYQEKLYRYCENNGINTRWSMHRDYKGIKLHEQGCVYYKIPNRSGPAYSKDMLPIKELLE